MSDVGERSIAIVPIKLVCAIVGAKNVFIAIIVIVPTIHQLDSAARADVAIGSAIFQFAGAELLKRIVTQQDFAEFDYILAMDKGNLAELRRVLPQEHRAKPRLLMEYSARRAATEVPDPYYGGLEGFEHLIHALRGVLADVDAAAEGFARGVDDDELDVIVVPGEDDAVGDFAKHSFIE